MSVSDLKRIIMEAGLTHDDCLEKSQLQERAREAMLITNEAADEEPKDVDGLIVASQSAQTNKDAKKRTKKKKTRTRADGDEDGARLFGYERPLLFRIIGLSAVSFAGAIPIGTITTRGLQKWYSVVTTHRPPPAHSPPAHSPPAHPPPQSLLPRAPPPATLQPAPQPVSNKLQPPPSSPPSLPPLSRPPGAPPWLPPKMPLPRESLHAIAELNARFHRSPYTASWSSDGILADAGLLIHIFDGWEASSHEMWAPAQNGPGATDMSASYVFAEQRVDHNVISLFGGGTSGLIFRPGWTRIKCGKAVDSAGSCGQWCDQRRANAHIEWNEGQDKLCAWQPGDFSVQLQRLTHYQHKYRRTFYNEVIIDAEHWRNNLPNTIEAIFGNPAAHARFQERYGLNSATNPVLRLDRSDWSNPLHAA